MSYDDKHHASAEWMPVVLRVTGNMDAGRKCELWVAWRMKYCCHSDTCTFEYIFLIFMMGTNPRTKIQSRSSNLEPRRQQIIQFPWVSFAHENGKRWKRNVHSCCVIVDAILPSTSSTVCVRLTYALCNSIKEHRQDSVRFAPVWKAVIEYAFLFSTRKSFQRIVLFSHASIPFARSHTTTAPWVSFRIKTNDNENRKCTSISEGVEQQPWKRSLKL